MVNVRDVENTTPDLADFEQVIRRYQRDIVNFHYRLVGKRFEAEDLAQETFLKAYLKRDSVRDGSKVRSWLYSIAKNVAIDFFRRNKNREIALDTEIIYDLATTASVNYTDHVTQGEITRTLEKIVGSLSASDRAIIKLLYYEGFSYDEICQMLHINKNTLKSRLHRARKAILNVIDEQNLRQDLRASISS